MRNNGSADGLLLAVVAILLVSAVASSWAHEGHEGMRVHKELHEREHYKAVVRARRQAEHRVTMRWLDNRAVEQGFESHADKMDFAGGVFRRMANEAYLERCVRPAEPSHLCAYVQGVE